MARTRASKAAAGDSNGNANGTTTLASEKTSDTKTDYSRWRLQDDNGRHTWHYLNTDEEVKKWPQSIADKWFLGMPTVSA
jgi:lanosterol synthase